MQNLNVTLNINIGRNISVDAELVQVGGEPAWRLRGGLPLHLLRLLPDGKGAGGQGGQTAKLNKPLLPLRQILNQKKRDCPV